MAKGMRFFAKNESGFERQQAVRVACKNSDGKKTADEIAEELKREDVNAAYVRNFWRDQLKAIEESTEGKLVALKGKLKPLKSGQGRRASATASSEEMAEMFDL